MTEDIKKGIRLDVTGNAVEQLEKIQKRMNDFKEKTDEATGALKYQESSNLIIL